MKDTTKDVKPKNEFFELIVQEVKKSNTTISQAELKRIVRATTTAMAEMVASGKEVRIKGFGTFTSKVRKARKGRNPTTGVAIEIAERRSPLFRPSTVLKTKTNEAHTKSHGHKAKK